VTQHDLERHVTTLQTRPSIDQSDDREGIPPLEPGDRLTRAKFERLWDAVPHVK